ncbi:MAG: hypothetical protein ACLT9J_10800 [Agathobacter rectalis]
MQFIPFDLAGTFTTKDFSKSAKFRFVVAIIVLLILTDLENRGQSGKTGE